MRYFFIAAVFLISTDIFSHSPEENSAFYFAHLREKIAHLEKQIPAYKGDKKGRLEVELASLFIDAQHIERALAIFLKSVSTLQKGQYKSSKKEKQCFEQLYSMYVLSHDVDALLEKAKEQLKKNTRFYTLNLLIAFANLQKQEIKEVLNPFFEGMLYSSDHFLSHYIQGALYYDLYKREGNAEKREEYRKNGVKYLKLSLEQNYLQVYAMTAYLHLASFEEGDEVFKKQVRLLIEKEHSIPRDKITLYMEELFKRGEWDLAKELIALLRKKYVSSRSLDEAEKVLQQSQNVNCK